MIVVRLRYGETSNSELNGFLRDNILIDVQKLAVDIENCKFTRKEPPIEYTMVELWMNIFQAIKSTFEDFEVDIEDLLTVAYEYYIPWSNVGNEYSQVRKSWIKKAMTAFCTINLAEELADKKGFYRVFRSKQIPKLVREYFAESLCNQILKDEIKKPLILDADMKSQKTLEGFMP